MNLLKRPEALKESFFVPAPPDAVQRVVHALESDQARCEVIPAEGGTVVAVFSSVTFRMPFLSRFAASSGLKDEILSICRKDSRVVW